MKVVLKFRCVKNFSWRVGFHHERKRGGSRSTTPECGGSGSTTTGTWRVASYGIRMRLGNAVGVEA
ncbi:MAG: hypothetical protein N3D11_17650, partial [Candidatus Sumerlaeia bacterium]|nr:hypothetical protein [Candidatus Sumerlaeia bacterium]